MSTLFLTYFPAKFNTKQLVVSGIMLERERERENAHARNL
jgi:hypothetical protein